MDALKAEINRKRKLNEDLRSKLVDNGGDSGDCSAQKIVSSRYIRAGDRQRMQEMELQEKQRALEEEKQKRQQQEAEAQRAARKKQQERLELLAKKSKSKSSSHDKIDGGKNISNYQEESTNSGSVGVPGGFNEQHYATLSFGEVKNRLRILRQPITLFGEDAMLRLQRLIEFMRSDMGRSEGFIEHGNYKMGKHRKTEDEEEAELDAEDLAEESMAAAKGKTRGKEGGEGQGGRKGGGPLGYGISKARESSGAGAGGVDADDDDEDDDDDGNEKKGSGGKPKLEWDHTIHFSKMPGLTKEKVVYKFFRALTKQWEADLNARDDWVKRTAKGKMETKTQKQCKDYIRPLFRMCKKKDVPQSILVKLALMVQHCEEGNFLAANDQYIQTAIGKSAWPIGVTMVGIHERSGRENISASKVAHIMNNEQERKYLTSVKRLMTYAQNKRTDVAPSMKVLNT